VRPEFCQLLIESWFLLFDHNSILLLILRYF